MTTQSISIELPKPAPLLSAKGWTAFLLALTMVCAVAPALNLWVPEDSALHLSDYMLGLLGKFMCYAICALAIDLIWGYTGILSLGHGLFFALGGYVMGMYLMREAAGLDALPAFMGFLDWKELPWHWALSGSFAATVLLVFLVPGLIGGLFGYFAFRSRIKGVYFSIITQALTYAAMLLFFRNETGFGGNNGFTGFKTLLGFSVNSQAMHVLLFALSGLALLGCFLFSRWLIRSKYGRVLQAVRDAESRTMFCGYNPLPYKLSIWVISAMMCGLAGALYVPQVGIINPSEMSVGNSIEMAVWTAVGGRASLVGPIIGAFAVNGGKSWLTVAAPEYWLYVLGALFIVVTLFMPGGLIRLPQQLRQWREKRKAQVKAPLNQTAAAAAKTAAESASADAIEGVRA
ncbi:urea ABC transporter permease subunit UrtC [Comamonas thiooxydans]|uniref:Urea ABC transporter permease subunit UrtC n=1 Tax=Comamonas thiooxydans TaxID=363952 RepID=A0AA42Q6M5_9BURK|nr:urea ABC transporter permease subunit UrtC [Comamonas thiooxydans]MDH1335708.1 urea ABC transporter permease subunit UrtC [Comamonas thiooxydans]MDH1741848.1 urea ABC transporter permease subunit UrtC [Comamonas thiooxydans]MDH1788360.1 urea ABC transporter permease subunit UrtC [Comamonas thiooxydans]